MSSLIPLYIYHTNDLHSNLRQWPAIVSFLKTQRGFHARKNDTALYLDLGDHADRVHPITEATHGRANVELLNEAGIHHATIGNNEGITFSKEELDTLYEDAQFKVLLANLYYENGFRPEWAAPYDILETKEGIRIGMIGFTVPFYPFYRELGWEVKDPFLLLPELLKEVREQSDIVILLSHLGYPQDEQIAQQFEGIDVILGAHTHHLLKTSIVVNETLISQCGKGGYYVGQIKLTLDKEMKIVVKKEGYAVDVSKEDPSRETELLLERLDHKAAEVLEEPIADIPNELTLSWTSPSLFADMFAEALKDWCRADISMLNSGLLLEGLPSGVVTRKDIHRLCPHPVNPCLVYVKGSVLKETVAAAFTEKMIHLPLKGFGFRGEKLGRMAFSGMDVEIEGSKNPHVKNISIEGESLHPDKTYKLATADMFTFGPLYPGLSHSSPKKYFMPETMRDILTDLLRKRFSI